MRFAFASFALLIAMPALAQEPPWLGKKVMTKFGGIGLVDMEPDGSQKFVARLTDMIYTVEGEQGDQIKVRHRGVSGWVDKASVVLMERAISYYTDILRQNPNDSTAYAHRGSAWHDQGENEQALKDYDAALQLNPNEVAWYNNRAFIRRHLQEFDKAIADYDAALKLNPESPTVYNNRGNAYREKKDYDKAIADYNEALK